MKLYDFYANWCNQCKMIPPVLTEFSSKHPEIEVEFIDVEKNQELCDKYKIKNLPTLVFENGDILRKHTGPLSLNQLEEFIYD